MKKFFALMLATILLTATAHAAEPVRIARIPIIFQRDVPDEKICAALEKKIERAIHIPLNDSLRAAEYLPLDESARVLNDIWQNISAADRKAKLATAMRPLADALDADIIVCPIVQSFRQTVVGFSSVFGDQFVDSHAAVELIVYDRRTDELLDKKASRMHHDSMSAAGTALYLATTCFDIVIEQTKLREKIRALIKVD